MIEPVIQQPHTGFFKNPAIRIVFAGLMLMAGFVGLEVSAGKPAIPSSYRSRKIIENISPELKRRLKEKGFNWGTSVFIRIFKKSGRLELWLKKNSKYECFQTYPICTYGGMGIGPKTKQGDGKAPEGFYYVTPDRLNPVSNYHLAFNIGYPNRYDRMHHRTGGLIMVHGDCVSIGCFAMTDPAIGEIYTLVDAAFRNGQPFFRLHIFPFVMTDENLARYVSSKWYDFWSNLKEGYDYFERYHVPPDVSVVSGRYVFRPDRSVESGFVFSEKTPSQMKGYE